MIKITMVVNKLDDRWEAVLDFNTAGSSRYNCDMMMEFLRVVMEDEKIDSSRVRKNITEKDGQVYYQLKIYFRSRAKIARFMALGSLTGRFNYNHYFCGAANSFFRALFRQTGSDDVEEVVLVEPQKVGIIRTTGARAGLSALVYFAIKMVTRYVEFEMPWLVSVLALGGALVVFLLLDMTLGRPGGITAKEHDRSFYSRNAEVAVTPPKKKPLMSRKGRLALQIGWRAALILFIIGIFVWTMWPGTLAEYWGTGQLEGQVINVSAVKYHPDSEELAAAEFTEKEDISAILKLIEETKCRRFKMDDSEIGYQQGFEISLITDKDEVYTILVEENKFMALSPENEQMENSGENLLMDYMMKQEFTIVDGDDNK